MKDEKINALLNSMEALKISQMTKISQMKNQEKMARTPSQLQSEVAASHDSAARPDVQKDEA